MEKYFLKMIKLIVGSKFMYLPNKEFVYLLASIAALSISIIAILNDFRQFAVPTIDLIAGILGVVVGLSAAIIVSGLFKIKHVKVFISYSLIDIDFVNKLSRDLRYSGFQVLRYDNAVMVGDDIRMKIEESILKSDFYVVVISRATFESPWIREEVKIALSTNKKVFPVMKELTDLPDELSFMQYADFMGEYEIGYSALVKSLRASLREPKHKIAQE